MGDDLMLVANVGQNQLSVLIAGCGNIAGGFDLGRSFNDLPYTHAP